MKRPRMWWTSVKGGRRAQRRPFKYTRDEMPDVPKRVLRAEDVGMVAEMTRLRNELNQECLPGCTRLSLAELHPGETKPDHLTDYSWTQVKFVQHVDGCPRLARAIERGQQVAKAFGWESS